jgi:hypothetical protein
MPTPDSVVAVVKVPNEAVEKLPSVCPSGTPFASHKGQQMGAPAWPAKSKSTPARASSRWTLKLSYCPAPSSTR